MINPLLVVMSVRDFPIVSYWLDKIDFVDKLIIKYKEHSEAHLTIRNYFLEHDVYTHLIIYAEDIIATPDHVKLLIEDANSYDYPVISGICNWDFIHNEVSITKKDLRNIHLTTSTQYNFLKPIDVISYSSEFPFMKVFFTGLPLTIIKRDVVKKITFRPYKYMIDNILGYIAKRGTMQDVAFAIDCANNNIPIYVDKRLFVIHFGNTANLINLKGKIPEVKFIPRKT